MVEHGFPRRIIAGEDAARALTGLLEMLGVQRVLLVTDENILGLEKTRRILEALNKGGYLVTVYSRVPPEPSLDVAEAIAETARTVGAEAIVAVGGGSVIDAAKAGLLLYVRPDYDVRGVAPFASLGLETASVRLIAIPTTAGTGSDVSYGIVLYDPEEGNKIPVGSFELIPFASILDPEYPSGAPRSLALGTAMDALGHAVEALTASEATILTDALAEKVIAVILSRLPEALDGSKEAWADLHMAATMAGIAFTNAGLGLIHAIAHPLGGRLRIHHGTLVGIVTPRVVEYLYGASDKAREKYDRVVAILESVYGLERLGRLDLHIYRLQERVGFPRGLSQLGVDREAFEAAVEFTVDAAYRDPEIVYSPVIPGPDDLRRILERLY